MAKKRYSNQGILLTGATGFLAGELLPRILDVYREREIYLLIRADGTTHLEERRQAILERARIDDAAAERVKAILGDTEKVDLGLGADYDSWAGKVTEIYHSAATTRFNQKLEKARQTNVSGTEHVLDFGFRARQLGSFVRLHHVSTAYVAGKRAGIIREDELDCGQEFFNTYEQSKCEAELLLRRAESELPITIYRPSIIVGDSRTGRTLHFLVIYEPMKWFYSGQMNFLPFKLESKIDVVPVDYVCDTMAAIGRRSDSAGKTYHITAGHDRSMNLQEMGRLCRMEMNKYNAEIGKPELQRPEIITPDIIEQLDEEGRKEYEKFLQQAWQQLQHHAPYAVSEKFFDDANTQAALADSHISCPSFSDYLPLIVRYALERQFRS